MNEPILDYLEVYQQRSNAALEREFARLETPSSSLKQAMHYGLFGNGKRIRPVLAYASAATVGEITGAVDAVASAVECIHAYSLIHDDLPAMDNDELRRGLPTCHIAFDEATAILAGDALQSLGFQILSNLDTAQPQTVSALVGQLAVAAGAGGMVAGQALDLGAVGKDLALSELETMHRFKTGALIRASVTMGAMATEAASPSQLADLERYAGCIGLAFQVQDDILDVAGNTNLMGKQQGADALRAKPTYVSLLGLDGARDKARELHESALEALSAIGRRADPLRRLSAYIVERSN